MPEILDADFPILPEDHWWKKELSENYRGIRNKPSIHSADGRILFAIHHHSDDFAVGKSFDGWGVFEDWGNVQLAQGLTAQEAVNYAYALFVLGEQDE